MCIMCLQIMLWFITDRSVPFLVQASKPITIDAYMFCVLYNSFFVLTPKMIKAPAFLKCQECCYFLSNILNTLGRLVAQQKLKMSKSRPIFLN